MRTDHAVTIHRHQYAPFPYSLPTISLVFDLAPDRTRVQNTFVIDRHHPEQPADLILNGIGLKLESVHVDGQEWADKFTLTDDHLTLHDLPAQATIQIVGYCAPQTNSTLMGLYVSGGNFFTQCEAEGFRRITWFADRPDVMSRYDVTLRAPASYTHLLSNGNLISTRNLPEDRHEAVWQDPFPKPCYLFALVAGQFTLREMTATTQSGREVLLQVYSDPGAEDRTGWALDSLHRSMQWDEARYGLELDLDRFMIVGVRDFNMGAMENKGLNIFNAALVLADPDTATDANYDAIEAVVGHEYFHNWTGNRVTCRDWFQLSLKEGLTVFRDQEFSADMMARDLSPANAASARANKRIDDVTRLRAAQFAEDAGPMAHPIRPESYQEIGNFYTATVYEKGAEIIRMQHTLLGETGFRAGMDEYFRRHDGQAVTCEDFVAAMESIYVLRHPGRDLQQFRRWYDQAGTPRVAARLSYDASAARVTLTLTQSCPPVGVERDSAAQGRLDKRAFHIPFALGLVGPDGAAMMLHHDGQAQETILLHLTEHEQSWSFDNIPAHPVPSLLRDFSAPVHVAYDWQDADLALLSSHDTNPFARWEAGQELATRQIFKHLDAAEHADIRLDDVFVQAWQALLDDATLDQGYRARALTLPPTAILIERMTEIDPSAVARARRAVVRALGRALIAQWRTAMQQSLVDAPYSPHPEQAGKRSLRALAATHLAAAGDEGSDTRLVAQFEQADNMTDRLAALDILLAWGDPEAARLALEAFYARFLHDPLVVDKWFSLQARSPNTTLVDIERLMAHEAFTLRNPNRVRALVFQFIINNPMGAHTSDGSSYAFWARTVLSLDAINPEIAARLARALDNWSRYTPVLRQGMQRALESVRAQPGLSANVREIVSKALDLAG